MIVSRLVIIAADARFHRRAELRLNRAFPTGTPAGPQASLRAFDPNSAEPVASLFSWRSARVSVDRRQPQHHLRRPAHIVARLAAALAHPKERGDPGWWTGSDHRFERDREGGRPRLPAISDSRARDRRSHRGVEAALNLAFCARAYFDVGGHLDLGHLDRVALQLAYWVDGAVANQQAGTPPPAAGWSFHPTVWPSGEGRNRTSTSRTIDGMYTETVKLRAAALTLALLVAAAPVLVVVCELDCDAPKTATQSCHKLAATQASVNLRDASHDCHQRHSAPDATMTSANARDFSTGSFVALVPTPTPFVFGTDELGAATHGPPGLSPHLSTPLTTVLRI